MGECDVEPDHGCSIGVHPKYLLTDSLREKLVEAIRKLPPKDIFCIEEVGLDFQVCSVTITDQRKQLKIFVEVATEAPCMKWGGWICTQANHGGAG